MEITNLFLFGDQTADFAAGLRRLFREEDNVIVMYFFDQCFQALHEEIGKLSLSEQLKIPRFKSLPELLERYCDSGPNPALESSLSSIYQLGCVINYYGDLGHSFPSSFNTYAIGLCTGLLSAAAVSSSTNIGQLLPLAVKTAVLALRLGLSVYRTQGVMANEGANSACWSVFVSGITEREALPLISTLVDPKTTSLSTPYISAVSSQGVTISAPPFMLDELVKGLEGHYRVKILPIHGPFHAPHLYNDNDIHEIIGSTFQDTLSQYTTHIPIFSSTTGNPIKVSRAEDLFKVVLKEILRHELRCDRITESCISICRSIDPQQCNLIPISSMTTNGLLAAFDKAGARNVALNNEIEQNSENSKMADKMNSKLNRSKIAIIGMSGRFPEADTLDSFWDLLYSGLDVHRKVPPDRWDTEAHVDSSGQRRNTSKVAYGCWIKEPGLFDSLFFNMSPREASQTDPAQRLALLTAYEALEMAGFIPDSSPSTQRDRVGVFYGETSDDYREVNDAQDIDTYYIPGGIRAFVPGRINYYFKFGGPSISIDTACSSSLTAIHVACNAIWRNDCDTAITGGVNILTNPNNHAGLDRGHFLSQTGNCNTFDNDADGYCRADGVGTIILKRLEDAQADNDPIFGVINSISTNYSAEAVSITRPDVGAQERLFAQLLRESNIDPKDVSYTEMHGTGTQAGDATEMESVLRVLAPDHRRGSACALHIGAAKANIGHGESASGIESLIKVALMMQKNTIPPHCGIKTKLNEKFPSDLAQRNVHIAMKPTSWTRPPHGKRRVLVNNFSAAGGNTALLMEDGPPLRCEQTDPRAVHLVAVSAKSQSSLRSNIEALVEYIDKQSEPSEMPQSSVLPSLAYTTTARRVHHPIRITATGSSLQEVRDSLAETSRLEYFEPVSPTAPNVAFVFNGQGAHYDGMGKQLYEYCSPFRKTLERCDYIGQGYGFPSILPLIEGSISVKDLGPIVIQLGTVCIQMALVKYWESLGIKPAFVMGHSLGEYAALNAAGVLTMNDTIYICGRRAQLFAERCTAGTHSMLVIKASPVEIKELLKEDVNEIVCINSPNETVVSSPDHETDDLVQRCSLKGLRSIKLNLPYAYHSSQVDPILESLEELTGGIIFQRPQIPYVSALCGEVIMEGDDDILNCRYISRHCREKVDFLAGLEAIRDANIADVKTIWLEIGNHPTCSGMLKATIGRDVTSVASLHQQEDIWKTLSQALSTIYLSGVDLSWADYHHDFNLAHHVLQLPSYKWNLKNHWIPYRNNFCLLSDIPTTTSEKTFLSSTAQEIIEVSGGETTASIDVESDITDHELQVLFQGHILLGAAICPSSTYADLAQAIGSYLVKKYRPDLQELGLDVCDMDIPKPFLYDSGRQFLRASATVKWDGKTILMEIYSVSSEQQRRMNLAHCAVKLYDRQTCEMEWSRMSYLIKTRMDTLQQKADSGIANRLQKDIVYMLFKCVVDYNDNFKYVEEVVLDNGEYEATARVKFRPTPGTFHSNPFWIDSMAQLTGFTMHVSDSTDPQHHVFINTGWGSMRFLKQLSPDVTYNVHVKIQPCSDSLWAGNVYVMEDDRIVAVLDGIKFQHLGRKTFDMILALAQGTGTSESTKERSNSMGIDGQPDMPTSIEPQVEGCQESILEGALRILLSEIGLSADEASDNMSFADYGVDSLLTLTITSRVLRELKIELDVSFFIDHPTMKDFKRFFTQMTSKRCSNTTTSDTESCSSLADDNASSIATSLDGESPMAEDQIQEKQNEFWSSLGDRQSVHVPTPVAEPKRLQPALDKNKGRVSRLQKASQIPAATSILLQGDPRTAKTTLFLFPDGSGSAASYGWIKSISRDVCVCALNSPYRTAPQNLKCSLDDLTDSYMTEIRKHQPKGPYNLGGWSAGGLSAFDAARALIANDEQVDRLFLIDSPSPIGLEKMPDQMFPYLSSVGILGTGEDAPPPWLVPHFKAIVHAMDLYDMVPLSQAKGQSFVELPETYIIWAKDGVHGDSRKPLPDMLSEMTVPRCMSWLLYDRTDLSPNGWDMMVGPDNVMDIAVIDDAHHFSLLKGEGANKLGAVLSSVLTS